MQFLKTLLWVLVAVLVAIIASSNWRDVTIATSTATSTHSKVLRNCIWPRS